MKIHSRGKILDLSFPIIMGILNFTPDSFFDGGFYNHKNDALKHIDYMIKDGAKIIDVGGESTRPGFIKVSVQEELDRVIPVIEEIVKRFDIWVSIDTSKSDVIKEAINAGVHIINDVTSLSEAGSLRLVIKNKLPICIVHNPKELTKTQSKHKTNNNIFEVVREYFRKKVMFFEGIGIKKNRMILDPGFGYAKNTEENFQLLKNLKRFKNFKIPLLVGMSRKRMIGDLLNLSIQNRLIGSISCAIIAAVHGAHIIRVHDVKETVQSIKVFTKVFIDTK